MLVLFAIAGCSQGVCRSIGSAPGTAPNPGEAAEEPVTAALVNSGEQEVLDEENRPAAQGQAPPHRGAAGRRGGGDVRRMDRGGRGSRAEQAAAAAAPTGVRAAGGPRARPVGVVRGRHAPRRAAAVVLRVGAAVPLIVEAPHTFFDQGTLPVALAIFEAQRARALIVNTSHRYGGGPNPRDASADDDGAEGGRPNLGAAVEAGAARVTPQMVTRARKALVARTAVMKTATPRRMTLRAPAAELVEITVPPESG